MPPHIQYMYKLYFNDSLRNGNKKKISKVARQNGQNDYTILENASAMLCHFIYMQMSEGTVVFC